jgi:hypothetical protein
VASLEGWGFMVLSSEWEEFCPANVDIMIVLKECARKLPRENLKDNVLPLYRQNP